MRNAPERHFLLGDMYFCWNCLEQVAEDLLLCNKIQEMREGKTMIPTFEQCVLITTKNKNFIMIDEVVNGKQVFIFDYKKPSIHDFYDPVAEYPDIDAFELRGLTFVFEGEGHDAPKRFIASRKFFNLGEELNAEDLDGEKPVRIQNKEDGSLITFALIGGNLYAKTRKSFYSDQAKAAQAIIDADPSLKNTIIRMIEEWRIMPIMEYISPDNQIVLAHSEAQLKVLQYRLLNYGYTFFDILKQCKHLGEWNGLKKLDSMMTEDFTDKWDLNHLQYLRHRAINTEGWVVTYNFNIQVKIKTDWYNRLHPVLSSDNLPYNKVIEFIIDDNAHEILNLMPKCAKRSRIEYFNVNIHDHIIETVKSIDFKVNIAHKTNTSRKDFADENKEYEYFNVLMHKFTNPELSTRAMVEESILFKTKKLNSAIKWLVDNELN